MKHLTLRNNYKHFLSLMGLVFIIISCLYLPFFNSIPQLSQFIPEIRKAEAWYSNDYLNRREVVLDGSKILTTSSSFPVLTATTLTDLRTVVNDGKVQNANGYDIIWIDSDDITPLDFEIEKYDASTGEIVHWVKTDLESSVSKTIYMYYNNDEVASSQENVEGVWDSNFVMVQHLQEDPGPGLAGDIIDSTQYANNGTAEASMEANDLVSGQIGEGLDFDGSDDWIDLTTLSDLERILGNSWSMNFWIKSSSTFPASHIIGSFDDGTTESFQIGWHSDCNGDTDFNKINIFLRDDDGNYYSGGLSSDNSKIVDGNWHHYVFGKNGNTEVYIYIDGQKENFTTGGGTLSSVDNFVGTGFQYPLILGAHNNRGTVSSFFNGTIDEVRVSDTVRSAQWITTEYNNQNDPTFTTFSAEQTENIAPTGYTVSINQSFINPSNQTAFSFSFSSAEIGATYNYSIDDTAIGSPVTGSGTISTTTDIISNIDVSGLNDDTLTLTVYLTDVSNNQGADATDTVIKDTTAPILTEVTPISPTTDTTPTYVFSSNEAGTIAYGGSCSSTTTSAISGNNSITLNELTPGTYADCTIIVTDSLNNISNTLSITSFIISSTGGGFIPPTPPIIPIADLNQAFEITNTNNQTTINLNNIQNVHQIAISTTPDFKNVSWEPYQEKMILPDINKVYLKFRSQSGGVSKVYEVETEQCPVPTEEQDNSNTNNTNNLNLPNGSLVKLSNGFKVYIINNNYLRHIINGKIFDFYEHLNWNNIQEVNSLNNYQESYLIRGVNDYKVYEIRDNKKHWLDISAEEFGREYSWEKVYEVNEEELGWYGVEKL